MRRGGDAYPKRTPALDGGIPRALVLRMRTITSAIDGRFDELRRVGVPERRIRTLRLVALGGPVAAFVLGLAVLGFRGGVLGLAAAIMAVESAARREAEAERIRFRRSFPDAVDLLAIACMAGMNPYRAFKAVGAARPVGCERTFEAISTALSAGGTVSQVLRRISRDRRSPELAALSRAISGAERMGSPLGPALMRLAADLREREIRSAQAAARKAPVKVLFPLVFCILPAFVLLTVVPVLADTFAVIRQ